MLGFAPVGKMSLGQIGVSSIVFASMVSVGAGSVAASIMAAANAGAAISGAGAVSGALTAPVTASTSMVGGSTFGVTNAPGSVATLAGSGAMAAVGVAVFTDCEVAGPLYELRSVVADYENRTAIVLFEDRVYEVKGDDPACGPPNRRRVL